MRLLRHLRWATPAALAICLLSCQLAVDPQADSFWSESDEVQRWSAAPAPSLPIYMDEDGSVKEGYGITDAREHAERTCSVHRVRMEEELQENKYMFYDERVRGFSRFFEMREKYFPNAQESVRSPLTLDWEHLDGKLLVRFCPQCRVAQKAWVHEIWPYFE